MPGERREQAVKATVHGAREVRALHSNVLNACGGAHGSLGNIAAELEGHLVKAQFVHLVHAHVGDETAVANDPNPRAGLLHLRQHVRREKDGRSRRFHFADEPLKRLLIERVETARRLVEDQQARAVHESQHQSQLLLVATRVLAKAPAEVELQPLGELLDARRVDAAAHPAEVRDNLAAAHPAELGQLAGEIADVAFHRNEVTVAVEPEDRRGTGGRVDDAHQEPDRGGLARAVGAEETEDLAFSDFQIEVEEPVTRSVVLGQPVHHHRAGHLLLRLSSLRTRA